MNKARQIKAFTLMEILIVVAIVAILVAISIPIFSNMLEKTRTSTCAANQRSLKAVLSAEYLLGTSERFAQNGEITLTEAEKSEFVCPSDGMISAEFEDDTIIVKCSLEKHNVNMLKISEKLSALQLNIGNGTRIDSKDTGNQHYAAIAEAFENLDVTSSSWVVLQTSQKGLQYVWTSFELTEYRSVPAVSYNVKDNNYTVGVSNINTNGCIGLNAENNGFGANATFKHFASYDEAMEYYKTLKAVKK